MPTDWQDEENKKRRDGAPVSAMLEDQGGPVQSQIDRMRRQAIMQGERARSDAEILKYHRGR